jgi:GNAT superfamily N-acetyltransferase
LLANAIAANVKIFYRVKIYLHFLVETLQMKFETKVFRGKEILNWTEVAANFRLSEFKNFPYLYAGNMDIEIGYLNHYAEDERSIFVLVFCDNEIAGIATGISLSSIIDTFPGVIDEFKKNNVGYQDFYYCGEFIVVKKYRKLGITNILFLEEIQHMKACGYKKGCIITVDRENYHPLKPRDYEDTDGLWRKLGFTKTNIRTQIKWPTIMPNGSVADAENSLTLWTCEIA